MSFRIINPTGYTLRPTGNWTPGAGYLLGLTALIGWRRKRREYEFALNLADPLTVSPMSGMFVRPDRHGITDLGSIPEQLEPLFPRNQYEASYIIHDSACREGGLYFSSEYDGVYVFCRITSNRAAKILRNCVKAEGGSWIGDHLIYRAVNRFGPQWTTKDAADSRKPDISI